MLPTGIHFGSYGAEAAVLRTARSRFWAGALLALLLAAPFGVGTYLLGILTEMLITLVAVFGLYVTVGMAGQINVAQSAFVGVGAFSAAKLSSLGVPVPLVIPVAALVTAIVSIVFALAAARVKGFYLALTTLAAQVIFPIVVLALPEDWLGGLVGYGGGAGPDRVPLHLHASRALFPDPVGGARRHGGGLQPDPVETRTGHDGRA